MAEWYQVAAGLAPVAVLLSAAVGATIALRSIAAQRATAAKKEALNHLQRATLDSDLIAARKVVNNLIEKSQADAVALDGDQLAPDELDAVWLALNELELVAVGTASGIIDPSIVAAHRRDLVITYWHALSPIVGQLRERTGNTRFYIRLERVAEEYERKTVIGAFDDPITRPGSTFWRRMGRAFP